MTALVLLVVAALIFLEVVAPLTAEAFFIVVLIAIVLAADLTAGVFLVAAAVAAMALALMGLVVSRLTALGVTVVDHCQTPSIKVHDVVSTAEP